MGDNFNPDLPDIDPNLPANVQEAFFNLTDEHMDPQEQSVVLQQRLDLLVVATGQPAPPHGRALVLNAHLHDSVQAPLEDLLRCGNDPSIRQYMIVDYVERVMAEPREDDQRMADVTTGLFELA